ncbi:hypothetical protein REPUB_Repub09cG0109300 [Reevesia pubescens]
MGKNLCDVLRGLKPVILILVVQAALAGVIVFYKLAVIDGMSMRVLITFRFIFATACLIPLAFILESRNTGTSTSGSWFKSTITIYHDSSLVRKSIAKLTWKIVFQGALSGLFGGALAPNLFIASLSLTSATFTTAMSNLVPIATFILAVILRMERLGIRTLAGQANGGHFRQHRWSNDSYILQRTRDKPLVNRHKLSQRWWRSGNQETCRAWQSVVRFIASSRCLRIFRNLAKMGENFPFIYSSSALMCITASFQATIYTIIVERNWSSWKLGWNIRLLSAFYTGAIGTALTVVLITWCLRLRGPLFVSIFNPLTTVYVAIVGSLILNERLNIGSISGSVLIILGVYVVLWGKAKEKKISAQLTLAESPKESEAVDVVIQDTNQSCDTSKANS